MNNSLKAILGAALLSCVMIGCESTQTRSGEICADGKDCNPAQCDDMANCDPSKCEKPDCPKKGASAKPADCPTGGAAKPDCDKSAAAKAGCDKSAAAKKKAGCDGMKKAMDCGDDCTMPCCA